MEREKKAKKEIPERPKRTNPNLCAFTRSLHDLNHVELRYVKRRILKDAMLAVSVVQNTK